MRFVYLLAFLTAVTSMILSCKSTGSHSETSASQSGTMGRSNALYVHLRNVLEQKYPLKNDGVSDVWSFGTMNLANDWVIQSPADLWGKKSEEIPRNIDCQTNDSRCNKAFQRLTCSTDADCSVVTTRCLPLEAAVSKSGQAAPNFCLAPADQLLNRYYRTMVSANKELDIASLSMPNGRFLTATINALSVLAQKPGPINVRLFFSGYDAGKLNAIEKADKHLKRVVELIQTNLRENGLDEKVVGNLQMDLAWLSFHDVPTPDQVWKYRKEFLPFLSWNHSKIVAADSNLALVGGHNMWDADYLRPSPIFDLSMEYSGDAVIGARNFLNKLWSINDIDKAIYPASRSNRSLSPFISQPSSAVQGSIKSIGIGRLGMYASGPESQPSDDALSELIRSAKEKVSIFQQDLYSQLKTELTATFAMDAITNAAVRGVHVTIVQSNKGDFGGYGAVEPKDSYRGVLDRAVEAFQNAGNSKDAARKQACAAITYAPFRFSAGMGRWPQAGAKPLGTHTKLVIVDDAAFYIGSHNLYPANLQEYGNIVFDSNATAQLNETYWSKLWKESEPSVLPCPY